MTVRKIIHIDMDAFFASVEQRDNPDLRGKPVAVGGSSKRGVVAAASYEARAFGVRSAMPSVTAQRRCPDLIFVKPRFDVYRTASQQIREIFEQYTDLVEPLSLDEAYLDVTVDKKGIGSAVKIAKLIRAEIKAVTGLTASAGVSYNKFIAKLASDQNKPDGLCVILPEQGADFVAKLPVRRFHGVGPRTAEKMERLGISTGADLSAHSEAWLIQNFGSFGPYLYGAARGIDDRRVNPSRERKSLGAELTYFEDKRSDEELHTALDEIAEILWGRLERTETRGRTIVLKARYSDFRTITRSRSPGYIIADKAEIMALGHQLLDALLPTELGIRLLGLTITGIVQDKETAQSIDMNEISVEKQRAFSFENIEN
jgi:DNA polymerase IV